MTGSQSFRMHGLRRRSRYALTASLAGNVGDCKSLGGGLFELRIDWGPGYRVYYAIAGRELVLLLCGGDKRKQQADIDRAHQYFEDYKKRSRTK